MGSCPHDSGPLEIVHEICNFGPFAFGREYLDQLALRASSVLDMRAAYIAAPRAGDPRALEPIVLVENGRRQEPVEYSLAGAPCENVFARQQLCYYDRDLVERFPGLPMPRGVPAVSWIGAPMMDQNRRPMGVFALMDDRPLSSPGRLSLIVEFLAARAAMELAREREGSRGEGESLGSRRSEKLESLGRLAGGIAHEFNNVLSAILGHAEMIEMKAGRDPDLRQHTEILIESVSRAGEITRKLQDFVRPGGEGEGPCHAHEAIREAIDACGHGSCRGIRFETRLEAARDLVDVGTEQLSQVLQELLFNARDAMPGGGTLSVRSRTDGEMMAIGVSDTGEGIAPELLDKVLDPYFTTKARSGARGMGLSRAYGLVTHLGGRLELDSRRGSGTTVTLRIPLAAGPAREDPAEQAPGGEQVILLAEDNDSIRAFLEALLKMNGYRVIAARSGDEALRWFEEHGGEAALVISDVNMPGLGGAGLLERIKERAPDLPCILITGDYTRLGENEAGRHSHCRLLLKPFRNHALLDLIEELLSIEAESSGGTT